ncbi:MAG: ABC transporter permease [Acidobacteriota bacterium]|nr:ABC transporter permease [Acidobacteriota bacterium]
MALWHALRYGLRNLAHSSERAKDVDDEVAQYFAEAEAAMRQRGMSAEEARQAVRKEMGTMNAAREQVRTFGWENTVRATWADLCFAMRQLVKHPAFTWTAVLTLALGIGANAAIFTVIQSVLLAPLPYANANRLVLLNTRWTDSGHATQRVTGPDAVDVRAQSNDLLAVSLYNGGNEGVQLRDHATYTNVTWVDENFSRVFDLQPIAGRLFSSAEANHAVLVSETFARDNFGSAQAALGQTLHIESDAEEIVGVLPAGFNFPDETQIWEASPLNPASNSRTAFNYHAVALLRGGAALKSAQAELNALSQRLQDNYPQENRAKVLQVIPLAEALTGKARPTLLLLWATVAMILLIACVNVTHLQLVRSMERQREIAIRKALGSSAWQVIRPVVMESLLVSLLGAVAGVLLALPTVRILVAMAPRELPRASEIHLNGWVLAFTLAIAVSTALIASLLPAVRAAKANAAEAMKQDAAHGMEKRGTRRLRDGLVIAEVAATFVLAVGAGMLLRTMTALMKRNMGYQTQQVLVVDADNPAHADTDYTRALRQFSGLFAQLGQMPGVVSAAGVMGLPTSEYGSNGYYKTQGGLPMDAQHKPYANFTVASPGYFDTMEIPLLRGRGFNGGDTADGQFVAVISESLAKQSFGDADPIGRLIQCGLDSPKWMTVVGVVGDVRQDSPAEQPGPTLYMPMAQHPYYANQIHIVLRTKVKPLSLVNAVRAKVMRTNPAIAMKFTTMDAMLNDSITVERFRAILLVTFAGAGLLLAMLGIYGTIEYSVAQRGFEIGIRMAFGANKGTILAGILKHASLLACLGIAIGAGASLMLTRLVTAMLVGVRPIDPVSLVSAALLLVLTAILAASAPGWKAAHVNPVQALRAE